MKTVELMVSKALENIVMQHFSLRILTPLIYVLLCVSFLFHLWD